MTNQLPRVFRMARWFKVVSIIATVLLCGVGVFLVASDEPILYRIGGAGLVVLGIGGLIDTFVSKIVLEEDCIRIISIRRRRAYPRSDFESAKVDGGFVYLKRQDGGWLMLPGTGTNALGMRNTVHAWIKKKRSED